MRAYLVSTFLLASAIGCSDVLAPIGGLAPPLALGYQLIPSGSASTPHGVLLEWDIPNDSRVTHFVIYSRASTSHGWSRRGETTSSSFHDAGIPHLQYYVTSADDVGGESTGSNVVTIDERNRMSPPAGLTSISLNRAVRLGWSASVRLGSPSTFDYYRVYSSPYDLDRNLCDDSRWVLEGTTVSEDFVATGLQNGVPRCFAVSTVSRSGHESVWTQPRADTPRLDARNVLLWALQSSVIGSGFRFELPGAGFGVVLAGDRGDLDFRVERRSDGSLWLAPVRAGTRVALYSTQPIDDLTSIDIAPLTGFASSAIEAVPGYGYVFETRIGSALHYGGVRVTHVGRDYLIFDWSYQSDPGNPELDVVTGGRQL